MAYCQRSGFSARLRGPGHHHSGGGSVYGPFDWTDRDELQPNQGLRHLLEKEVIKSSFASAEAVYEAGSPLLRDLTSAPPMMIVHGDQDSLVPVGISRKMAALHRAQAETPCVYLEIPGAQHAFDIFASPRSEHTKLVSCGFSAFAMPSTTHQKVETASSFSVINSIRAA